MSRRLSRRNPDLTTIAVLAGLMFVGSKLNAQTMIGAAAGAAGKMADNFFNDQASGQEGSGGQLIIVNPSYYAFVQSGAYEDMRFTVRHKGPAEILTVGVRINDNGLSSDPNRVLWSLEGPLPVNTDADWTDYPVWLSGDLNLGPGIYGPMFYAHGSSASAELPSDGPLTVWP